MTMKIMKTMMTMITIMITMNIMVIMEMRASRHLCELLAPEEAGDSPEVTDLLPRHLDTLG